MVLSNIPLTEIIRQRYACRAYQNMPVSIELVNQIKAFSKSIKSGPFGTQVRFELVVASEQDRRDLRGLGTYGLIKDPPGFIIGVARHGDHFLEDFGYRMETVILFTTSLDLATCWLGGNFTKTSFSKKAGTTGDEVVPAVVVFGHATEESRTKDRLRQKVKSNTRQPWEKLFFLNNFEIPLDADSTGKYAIPLEMLRLAPSSHNYQPWRIVQDGLRFHFYLRRTRSFKPGNLIFTMLDIVDLQRMEIGIAMCHFELSARELGLEGEWIIQEPDLLKPEKTIEYIVTWVGKE